MAATSLIQIINVIRGRQGACKITEGRGPSGTHRQEQGWMGDLQGCQPRIRPKQGDPQARPIRLTPAERGVIHREMRSPDFEQRQRRGNTQRGGTLGMQNQQQHQEAGSVNYKGGGTGAPDETEQPPAQEQAVQDDMTGNTFISTNITLRPGEELSQASSRE